MLSRKLSKWNSNLSVLPKISSTIILQVIWYNKHILVDKRSLYNATLANKGINHVGSLFDINGAIKLWSVFKRRLILSKDNRFYWI